MIAAPSHNIIFIEFQYLSDLKIRIKLVIKEINVDADAMNDDL